MARPQGRRLLQAGADPLLRPARETSTLEEASKRQRQLGGHRRPAGGRSPFIARAQVVAALLQLPEGGGLAGRAQLLEAFLREGEEVVRVPFASSGTPVRGLRQLLHG